MKPEHFGVIVAESMFGDILSEFGAGVMGGLGFAPSVHVGRKVACFSPVHGSLSHILDKIKQILLTCFILRLYC